VGLRAGTTPNGVFGAKLMWGYFGEFVSSSATSRLPEFPRRADAHVFPNLTFVRVVRANKVRQAVSLWKAVQTANWRGIRPRQRGTIEADGSPLPHFIEAPAPAPLPLPGDRPLLEHSSSRAAWSLLRALGNPPDPRLYENSPPPTRPAPEPAGAPRPLAPDGFELNRDERQSDGINDD